MEQLARYSVPTRYDVAPRGTICTVCGDNGDIIGRYVQTGATKEENNWIPMGELLEKTFSSFVGDHEFVAACLDMIQGIQGSHMQIIIEKIKPK